MLIAVAALRLVLHDELDNQLTGSPAIHDSRESLGPEVLRRRLTAGMPLIDEISISVQGDLHNRTNPRATRAEEGNSDRTKPHPC